MDSRGKPKIRISGARIAPLGGSDAVLEGSDLWIADGRIAAITPVDSAPPFAGDYQICAFDNALVLPGLVNSHSHSASALQRGTSAGAPLDLYVMEAMSRRSRRPLPQIRISALVHAVEMLKRGITGVVDHFRGGAVPSVEAVSTVFAAYDDIGIRAVVAPMFEDKCYIDSLPIDESGLPDAVRERWRARKTQATHD